MASPADRRRRQRREPDGGIRATATRIARDEVDTVTEPIIGATGNVVGLIRRDEVSSPLSRHHARREITTEQYVAGVRFAETA